MYYVPSVRIYLVSCAFHARLARSSPRRPIQVLLHSILFINRGFECNFESPFMFRDITISNFTSSLHIILLNQTLSLFPLFQLLQNSLTAGARKVVRYTPYVCYDPTGKPNAANLETLHSSFSAKNLVASSTHLQLKRNCRKLISNRKDKNHCKLGNTQDRVSWFSALSKPPQVISNSHPRWFSAKMGI